MYFSLPVYPPDVETVLLSLFFCFYFSMPFKAIIIIIIIIIMMMMMMMMMMIQLMTLGIALLWALPRVHPNLHPTAWAEMTLSSAQNIFYTCKHKIPQFIVSGRWGWWKRERFTPQIQAKTMFCLYMLLKVSQFFISWRKLMPSFNGSMSLSVQLRTYPFPHLKKVTFKIGLG